MPLDLFAYVDESEDDNVPAGSFMEVPKDTMLKGDKRHVKTENGGYDLIGLDAISYTDQENLVQQVNVILTEMGI